MRPNLKDESGVSMLEMMIVCVLIGLMAALASPNLYTAIKKTQFDAMGRDMANALRYARAAAVSTQEPQGVFFDYTHKKFILFVDRVNPGDNTYAVGDSIVRSDSMNTEIVGYFSTTFPNQAVVFGPDGRASAGGVILCMGSTTDRINKSYTINVTAGSGRADLEYYNY